MRTLALSLATAGLLALTACGDNDAVNNSSTNTLGTEALPPLDNGTGDLGNTGLSDLNTSSNSSLGADTNLSSNTSATTNGSVTSNTVGNTH
jgi:hypothetical protein